MEEQIDFDSVVKDTYTYYMKLIGLKEGVFNQKLSFYNEWQNKVFANFGEKIKDKRWVFEYIGFQFQSYINWMNYKKKPWSTIYPSTIFASTRIRFFIQKNQDHWWFFVERDILQKYGGSFEELWPEEIHPSLNTAPPIKDNSVPKINKEIKTSIEKSLELDRKRFLNDKDRGFLFCQMEQIPFNPKSNSCLKCNHNIQCQNFK